MKIPKNFLKIIILVLILAVLGVGVYLFTNWRKKSPTAEEKGMQRISEEVGKSKFEANCDVANIDKKEKKITCKVQSGSNTIKKYFNKETQFLLSEQATIFNKEGQLIQLSDLKSQNQTDIKGTIEGNNLTAELIVLR